ncbi:MAG: hypothetical protein ACFBSE_16600 [Prochloraceae cyanobacterium]
MFATEALITEGTIVTEALISPLVGELLTYSENTNIDLTTATDPNNSIAVSEGSSSDLNYESNNLSTVNLNNNSSSLSSSSLQKEAADPLTGVVSSNSPIVGEEIDSSADSSIATVTADTFETRAQRLLAQFTTTNVNAPAGQYSKYAFWYAQALFYSGAIEKARSVVDLAHQTPFDDYSFYYWSTIDTYFRWNQFYTPQQKERAKQNLVTATNYNSGITENHKIMLAATRFLASEEWSNEIFASNYSLSDPTGKQEILTTMSEFVTRGMVEHDSPVYHAMYLGVFRTLADFAKDIEVKQKAEIVFEWLLANPSGEWLEGHWAASSLRKFPYVHSQNQYGAGQYSLWLFFGGAEPASFSIEAAYAVQHAVSGYRPPEIIEDIARERQTPYLHRAYDRWNSGVNDRFYKTTYMAPEFAIYSQMEQLGDRLGWSEQGHRWGIVWTDSDRDSIFWVTHPRKSPNADNKTRGITDYEQVLQHNKTIVGVYDIPANDPYKYVIGKTPQGFIDFIDRSDRGEIYLDYGDVKIGLSLFTIGPNGETIGFDWSSLDTQFQGPRSISQDRLKIGLVAVAASRNEFANLTEFANALDFQGRIDRSQLLDANPRIQYTDLDGHLLDLRFDRHFRVDNRDLDLAAWPLMENPWTTYPRGGNMQLNFGSRSREYIFGPSQWSVRTNGLMETNGSLLIEAENFVRQKQRLDLAGGNWTVRSAQLGYNGTGYVESSLAGIPVDRDFTSGAEISYDIEIQNPGNYNIWVRRYATDKTNNSVFFSIDGQQQGGVDNVRIFDRWTWQNLGSVQLDRGPHSFQLRRREAGYKVDSILLTTDPTPPV